MDDRPSLLVATYGIGRMQPEVAVHYLELLELLRARFDVDVVEIKNEIGVFSNPRSGESEARGRVTPLSAEHRHFVSDFRTPKYEGLLEYTKRFVDVHRDGYGSNSNLIQQLLMLEAISDQIQITRPLFVLCIRDDLYFCPKKTIKRL